jgi:hypothetical protein
MDLPAKEWGTETDMPSRSASELKTAICEEREERCSWRGSFDRKMRLDRDMRTDYRPRLGEGQGERKKMLEWIGSGVAIT